ncbi:MAG: polyhydroxyalkanoic acid system family protein [Gammaproteobacteria bacterium]|nr:polyhydroxyalkanoic acid system family protein [Gammaproteobacteria bacterium]
MTHIDIRHAHSLDPRRAREVMQEVAQKMIDKYQVCCRWEGDSLHFERPGLNGCMVMDGNEVHVTTTLGVMLRPMRTMIEQQIRQQLSKLLPDS